MGTLNRLTAIDNGIERSDGQEKILALEKMFINIAYFLRRIMSSNRPTTPY